jgi:hypothetical protein
MTSRHALLPAATAAIVLVLALVFPFAGCGLPLQGLSSDADAGSPCNADSQCVDKSPCTTDSCVGGACKHVMQPDGPAPSTSQIAFDCKVVQCKAGEAKTENDDTDIQADAEDCTIDQCNAGEAFHTAKPDNTSCVMGGDGICMGGQCQITCTTNGMCDDKNPCTEDTCDVAQGVCSFSPLNGVNTPGKAQIAGDCKVQVCVDGMDTKSADDSDLPKTATDCDEELCNGGVPSNPPRDIDVSCGPGKARFCDGAGVCVECNNPTTCPGLDNDCQVRSCTAHVCGITFTPVGTPRAQAFQTNNDCLVVVCDGAGSSAPPKADDTDLPDDGNACTKDICTAGVISHSFEAINTACGNNSACNAVGQCGCANDSACMAPNTCGGGSPMGTPFICGCTLKTCASLGKTCGSVTDGCFSTQNCDNGSKEGSETDIDCGGGAAGTCGDTCAIGKQCLVDTDCGAAGVGHCADGVCCNSACTGTCQACSNAKKGNGPDGTCGSIAINLQDPNATTTCVGNNVCDGANHCKKIDGQTCSMNSDCVNGSCADGVCCNAPCTGTCLACTAVKKGAGVDGVCGNIAINQPDTQASVTCTGTSACDGTGFCKKAVGQACASNGACANANCIDGVCCGVAGGCPACQSCAVGANGTCGNIPAGPDNAMPNTCTGTSSCDSMGNCKKSQGQACLNNSACANNNCLDGFCCGSANCPSCQVCTGAGGTCTAGPAGQDNTAPNTCNGNTSCDAGGNCKKINGQACVTTLDCATGTCVDLICCGSPSCPSCQTCTGALGTCTAGPAGQDNTAPNTCNGSSSCDAGGNCKKINGQPCATTLDCATGTCVDLVCCGTPNCPTCQVCGGVTGVCGPITAGMPDNTAPNACPANNVCDAAGACKKDDGQTCLASTECYNGNCVDGVCCNSPCTTQCMACNALQTGGADGVCSNIIAKAPDLSATTTCVLPMACDGAGVCKQATGQPCTMNSDCASALCLGTNFCF